LRQTAIKIVHRLADYTDLTALERSLPGLTREYVKGVKQKVFYFQVGEFVAIAPDYISDAGLILAKTRQRRTEHAGGSFLTDGGGSIDIDEYADIVPADDSGNDLSSELFGADDEENNEEEIEEVDLGAAVEKKDGVDYMTILITSLIGFGAVGIVYALMKSKKREKDKELSQIQLDKEELERKVMLAASLRRKQEIVKDEKAEEDEVFKFDKMIYGSKLDNEIKMGGHPEMRVKSEDIKDFLMKLDDAPPIDNDSGILDDFW